MNQETIASQPTPHMPTNGIGFPIIFSLALLIPLFFVPTSLIPLQFSKAILVAILGTVALGWFLYHSLKQRTLPFSWSLLHVSLWILPLAYLISIPFSSQPSLSFLGHELSTDTFGFIIIATTLAHVVALGIQKKAQAFSVFIAFFIAALGVFAFQIVQIIFNAPFPFLSDPSLGVVGRWSDFGLFAGFIGSLILLALESLPLARLHRIVLSITFIVSLIALVFVNTREVWILFGVASFVPLVFGIVRGFLSQETPHNKFTGPSILPAVGLVTALFFLLFGSGIATSLQRSVSINAFDVRPSFQSTIDTMTAVYSADPIFGSGPNTFSAQWLLYRSPDIVQTPFWNLSFTTGFSSILSSIATGGIVIAVAWILFVLALLYSIVRALFVKVRDQQSYVVISLSVLGTLYLLAAHLFYTPSQSITLLFFLCIGVFMATVSDTSLVNTRQINLRNSPRFGFTFVLVSIIVMLVAAGFVYVIGKKYAGVYFHNRAIQIANQGDVGGGVRALESAIALDPQDRYFRTAALINLSQINTIVQSGDTSEASQTTFQNELAKAVQNTARAVQIDPKNFSNLMTRALVFESVIPLGIDGALENTITVYDQARALNPLDPEVDVRIARIRVSEGNTDSARTLISNALSKKADYTDAILTLAQIELTEGNLSKAIESVRAAVYFEPQNSVLLYQLGILLLQGNDYKTAATAFEEALRLNSNFANASFFLAQAYAFERRYDDAASLLAHLVEQNPDNELVKAYRDQLAQGNNPFDQVPTPPTEETSGTIE